MIHLRCLLHHLLNYQQNYPAFRAPADELTPVKLDPLLGAKFAVAPVANKGTPPVSDDSSATVTVVAMAADPVVF